jgi:hypothetical protein
MTRQPPPRPKTEFAHVTSCDAVQKRLRALYGQLGSWKLVGAEIKVSPAMAQRVATTDYRPKSPAIRAALGLPVLASAPVCPSCGVVHIRKTCPAAGKPAKPRTGPTRQQTRWLKIMGMLWGGQGPAPRGQRK